MDTIDIRCPENPRVLFLKLKRSGEDTPVVDGNLIELACERCRNTIRQSEPDVLRVLHRYDLTGELIETEVVRATPEEIQRLRARGVARANRS